MTKWIYWYVVTTQPLAPVGSGQARAGAAVIVHIGRLVWRVAFKYCPEEIKFETWVTMLLLSLAAPPYLSWLKRLTIFWYSELDNLYNLQFASGKSASEKKEMVKKIETQLVSFNGKEKLTVDEYYSVLKVQVKFDNNWNSDNNIFKLFVRKISENFLFFDFDFWPGMVFLSSS